MNQNNNELKHYGVLGMKWGKRKAVKNISKITTKRKQINKELKELQGYEKNPSAIGKSKISTAIRRNQINSLNRMDTKLNKKEQYNKAVLKSINELDKVNKAQKAEKMANKEQLKKAKKEWKDTRKEFLSIRGSAGRTVGNYLLNGPFGAYTYNSLRAAGYSRAVSEGVTIASDCLGGPLGNMIVSKVVSNKQIKENLNKKKK